MKFNTLVRSHLAAAAFLAVASLPGTASAQAGISPGMQVVDQAGNPVGTVIAVKGGDLTLKTDRHEVLLPKTSFTPNEGKLLFGMTQAQLNADMDQALAAAAAAVTVGAEVRGTGGQVAGTIEALDDATVTLKLVSGEMVRLPRHAVAGSQGGAVLGVSLAELQAMTSSSAEATASVETEAAATAETADAAAPAEAAEASTDSQ
jgi:preprotein translocase subunit YajC